MNKVFKNQIDYNIELYVDNILVKSHTSKNHEDDLEEIFAILGKYHMKLNLAKCTFEVISRKFFRFMVSHQGIEANLEKIHAIR